MYGALHTDVELCYVASPNQEYVHALVNITTPPPPCNCVC